MDLHLILGIAGVVAGAASVYLTLNIKLAIAELRFEISEKQTRHAEELRTWAEAHFVGVGK